MDNRVKTELDKMFLLMERMDNHYTLDESLEMENRIENKRESYTDLNQFLSDVNLGRSFVGLCYIQGYETRKIYPTNKETNPINGMTQADSIKDELGKLDKNSRIYGKINSLVKDSEFTNPTGRTYAGNKSMKTPYFSGIIKITNYVFNWGNKSSMMDFYNKNKEEEKKLRQKYGFGKMDSEYGTDDWRRRDLYHGTGISPEESDNTKKNPYRGVIDANNSLFGEVYDDGSGNDYDKITTRNDGTQYQKKAFRFAIKNIEKQWSQYCLVDARGEIDYVSSNLGKLMQKNSGVFNDIKKHIVPEMSQDEKDFINALSELRYNNFLAEKTWVTDNIAYIVACEYDPRTQTRRYVRYINPDLEINSINVNQGELKEIVDKEIAKTEIAVKYKKDAAE